MSDNVVTVPIDVIVELFRAAEYARRDLDTQGIHGTRIAKSRLKNMSETLHSLAPDECERVSWGLN